MSDFAGRGFGSPRRGGPPASPYGSPAGNRGTYVGGDSFGSPVRGRGGYGSPRGGGRGSPYGGSPGRGGYGSNEPMPVPAQHDNLVQQKLAHGTEGRPVELIANFFKFTTTDVTVYHYDVDVKKDPKDFGKLALQSAFPEAKKEVSEVRKCSEEVSSANLEKFIMKFSPLIVNKLISQRPDIFGDVKFVYDGHKNLYTVQKLDFSKYKFSDFNDTVQIDVDNRPVDFVAKLKLVEQVDVAQLLDYYSGKRQDLPPGRAISMYEIVFRSVMAQAHEPFQRKFYDLSTAQNIPRMQNVDFVQGYSSAVRATEFGLALNIHSRTSCLASKSLAKLTDLASYLANINPSKRPSRLQLLDVNKFARNLKIYTVHSNRTVKYGMDGLVDMFPSEVEFMHQGEKVSIESYFKKVYNLELQKLPLARTTGKHSRYLPMELCYLSPNQFLPNNKLNAAIQRELLLKSTHTPNALFSKLDSIAKKVAQTETKVQEKFGIKLDPRPVALKGRVLPTPRQLCPNNREKFYSTKETPKRWAVFCLDQTVSVEQLKAFVGQLKERARFFGLNFGEPSPVVCMEISDMKTMVNAFNNLYTKSQAEFVFVGIPSRNNAMAPPHMYATVKHLCEQRFGIMSQCFSVDKLLQTPVGYFDNFLLKTNGKLGGLNALVEPSQYKDLPFNMAKTMMIGIDVNHPADTEHLASSVSVAVGSLDAFYSKYTASIRLQKKDTDEILKHLDTMIKELLIEFFKTNYRHPDNLIIFRDGVSEGQFDKITKTELPLIQAGINSVGMPTKITLIVNQKHHNTRFALAQVNTNGRKPTWNVPSGTVVDSTIVEPTRKSFYLNSHFSPLGTSRPTKYVILRDDLNMTADQVQRMTFLACYNSIRTRGVLAIPTPTRYADLCAYRSKLLVEAQLRDSSDLGVTHTGKFEVESEMIKKLNEMVKVNDKLKDRLYYC